MDKSRQTLRKTAMTSHNKFAHPSQITAYAGVVPLVVMPVRDGAIVDANGAVPDYRTGGLADVLF